MERTEMITTAEKLLATAGTLTALLGREIDTLYTSHNTELAELVDEKNALLTEYSSSVASLRNAAAGRKLDLPAPLAENIRRSTDTLATAMGRNLRALAAAHEASQGVVNVIIEEVKRQRNTNPAYGVSKQGTPTTPPAPESAAQAVTFDERL